MKKLIKIYFIALLFVLDMGVLCAQEKDEQLCPTEISAKMRFRVDKTYLSLEFCDNAASFEAFLNAYNQTLRTILYNGRIPEHELIESVVIVSGASPEGPLGRNVYLSRGRAESLIALLESHGFMLSSYPLVVESRGVDWVGFRYAVKNADYITDSQRNRILEIIDSVPEPQRVAKISAIDSSKPWNELKRREFSPLRFSEIKIVFKPSAFKYIMPQIASPSSPKVRPMEEAQMQLLHSEPVAKIEAPLAVEKTPSAKVYQPALKTNLLYDAATLLNIAAEFPLGRTGLTLNLAHQFPWWRTGPYKNKNCIRDVETSAELRYYFKHDKTAALMPRGHFLGLYASAGMWDFQFDKSICYQGEVASAGLTYGYSMPLNKHLNLEFSVSAGYAKIPYRHFFPTDDYSLLIADPDKVGIWHYFGPTKAQISLIYPIKIGGRRK